MLVEALVRAGLVEAKTYQEQHNPPSYAKRSGDRGYFICLWYDNLLATFKNPQDRDDFACQIQAVCAENKCEWKHFDKWNLNKIGPATVKKPVYLGMEFCTTQNKRSRDDGETIFDTAVKQLAWRHDMSRRARWADTQSMHGRSFPRMIARCVGIILWDATINGRSFHQDSAAIDMLRAAASRVSELKKTCKKPHASYGWDLAPHTEWPSETVSYLKQRVDEIMISKRWIFRSEVTTSHTVCAASDASGKIGYGVVYWTEDGRCMELERGKWCRIRNMSEAHIFLKEFHAATRAVELLAASNPGCRILLAVDNTAVCGAMKVRYSSNREGCKYLSRIETSLDKHGCILEIVPVRSADNGADAPSRDKPLDLEVAAKCRLVMEENQRGHGRLGERTSQRVKFTGGLRHEEPDDDEEEDTDAAVGECVVIDVDGCDEVYDHA
jgi:hypothetical protein